jgi:hypothetical protein
MRTLLPVAYAQWAMDWWLADHLGTFLLVRH